MLLIGCAAPEPVATGTGETITLRRELDRDMQPEGFAVVGRQTGWMRYILIEPGGYRVEPTPGDDEIQQFHPRALHDLNRAVTEQNQDTRTPRPLLGR